MGTLTAVLQHRKTKTAQSTPRDGARTFAQWLDELADGECDQEELIDGVHDEIDSNPDAGWELLALVDQYYRRHRIGAEDFRSLNHRVQAILMGGVQTAEVTPATAPPEEQPVSAAQSAAPPAAQSAPTAAAAAQSAPTAAAQPPPTAAAAAAAAAHDPARPAPRRSIAVNDVLRNRYRVQRILGRGGMGTVYAATDLYRLNSEPTDLYRLNNEPGDQNIALKVLHTEVIQRPGLLAELRREFQILQSLSHPNIVRVHEFDQDGDLTFFTMERLDGVPLSRMIAEQKSVALYRPYALAMIRQVGAAVAYAHSRSIVHGDLNPANVLVTDSGEIRVLDFGAAYRMSPFPSDPVILDADPNGDSRPSVATPTFASCELLEGKGPLASDDVYALACISYVLLTGEHPFQCRNALAARKAGHGPRRPAGLSSRQWRALKAGLSFDRKQRPADAQAWLDSFPLPVTPTQLPPLSVLMAEPPTRRPAGPWLTCVVIALVAGVCWWAQDQYHFMGSVGSGIEGGNTVAPRQPVPAPQVTNPMRPPAAKTAPAVAAVAVPQSTQSEVAPAKTPSQRAPRPVAATPQSATAAEAQIEMAASTVEVPDLQAVASVPVHRRHNYRSAISFTWSTEAGTARAGQDFVPVTSRTEYMPAGDPETRLLVPIVADPRRHVSKTFYVVINTAGDGATLGSRILTMVTIPAAY
jgi:serine/threonine protein kinase